LLLPQLPFLIIENPYVIPIYTPRIDLGVHVRVFKKLIQVNAENNNFDIMNFFASL
jgi:hypothetical protein